MMRDATRTNRPGLRCHRAEWATNALALVDALTFKNETERQHKDARAWLIPYREQMRFERPWNTPP